MARRTEKIQITDGDGAPVTLEVRQLGGRDADTHRKRALECLAQLARGQNAELTEEKLETVAALGDVTTLRDAFMACTRQEIAPGGPYAELAIVYDDLFAGNLRGWMEWFSHCLQMNYLNFSNGKAPAKG